jgi:hypothetical protein
VKRHAITRIPRPDRSGSGLFDSQSWKWLTERLAYLPQVRLVFGEVLPKSAQGPENFEAP